jgi:hypothetical protein
MLFNKLGDQLASIFVLDVNPDSYRYASNSISYINHIIKVELVTLPKTFGKLLRFASRNISPTFSFACFNPSSSILPSDTATPATTTATATTYLTHD